MHDLDPTFSNFSRQKKLAMLCNSIGIEDPLLLQSMYICKQPRIGGEVTYHQDSSFLFTEPESCVGFWVAIEDATVENGCMWAAAGGHKAPLRKRFKEINGELKMVELDHTPFPKAICTNSWTKRIHRTCSAECPSRSPPSRSLAAPDGSGRGSPS